MIEPQITVGISLKHLLQSVFFFSLVFFQCVLSLANEPFKKFLIIQSTNNGELQEIIDKSLLKISQTLVGKQIIHRILNCNPEAVEIHLGVSRPVALSIAEQCKRIPSVDLDSQSESFVKQSPPNSLIKAIDEMRKNISPKRTYAFLVTYEKNWSMDSWTNSATNETSIVLPSNVNGGLIIDEARITEILAHETAIYFDSKFWSGSTQFNSLPGAKQFLESFTASENNITLALDNPIIAYSLAFLRAFKVEQSITNELLRKNKILFSNKDQIRRQQKIRSFFLCKANCIHKFLIQQIDSQRKMILPLVAYASSYRSRLWTAVRTDSFVNPSLFYIPYNLTLKDLLVDIPTNFYIENARFNIHALLESFTTNDKLNGKYNYIDEFNLFMYENILPVHIVDLKGQKGDLVQFSNLDYMTEPLLSGYNIRMSSGPRPRIIVGGF